MTRNGESHGDPAVVSDAAQPNKPVDTALKQQRLRAWQPILHPVYVIMSFLVLGAVFTPLGYHIQSKSRDIVELSIRYDASDGSYQACGITEPNENKTCPLTFTIPKDMNPPILIHYQLENFYQNQLEYVRSRDDKQLLGNLGGAFTTTDYCQPLRQLGNITLNPCGLIANTLFNDVFSLTSGNSIDGAPLVMKEKGIAWTSDIKYKFKQPDGFYKEACNSCDECSCDGEEWSCEEPFEDDQNICYRYFYPEDDTTQYLHETYDKVVSPIEGVTNEHFIVWMRTAALPTFRKLYGYIDQPISSGQTLTFQINANYEVKSFKGAKTLILSTNNDLGGKNEYVGMIFLIVGVVLLVLGLFFGFKHFKNPRVLADQKYLYHSSAKED